ncbi:hypothetical protein IAU60_004324 [Kwoniella sp. DSM 27419]
MTRKLLLVAALAILNSALGLPLHADTSLLQRSSHSHDIVLPTGWSKVGCIAEAERLIGRALPSDRLILEKNQTIQTCVSYCGEKGWQYAGLEYGFECYCADYIDSGAYIGRNATNCDMPCPGNSSITCGGSMAIQLYQNPSLALNQTVVEGFALQGCIKEVVGRALPEASFKRDNMTIQSCLAFCNEGGYKLGGVEFGDECYCANALHNNASRWDISTQCKMDCAGAPRANGAGARASSGWGEGQILDSCGGWEAIQLYAKPGALNEPRPEYKPKPDLVVLAVEEKVIG